MLTFPLPFFIFYFGIPINHLGVHQGTAIRDRIQERLMGQQSGGSKYLLPNGKDDIDNEDEEYYDEDDEDEEYYDEEEYYESSDEEEKEKKAEKK